MWVNNHSWQCFCFVAAATLCPIFPVISCTEVFTRQSFIPAPELQVCVTKCFVIVFNWNMSTRWPCLAMVVCPLWSFPQPLMKRKFVSRCCNNPLAVVRTREMWRRKLKPRVCMCMWTPSLEKNRAIELRMKSHSEPQVAQFWPHVWEHVCSEQARMICTCATYRLYFADQEAEASHRGASQQSVGTMAKHFWNNHHDFLSRT